MGVWRFFSLETRNRKGEESRKGAEGEGRDLSRADALRRRAQLDGPPSIILVCALTCGAFPFYCS